MAGNPMQGYIAMRWKMPKVKRYPGQRATERRFFSRRQMDWILGIEQALEDPSRRRDSKLHMLPNIVLNWFDELKRLVSAGKN